MQICPFSGVSQYGMQYKTPRTSRMGQPMSMSHPAAHPPLQISVPAMATLSPVSLNTEAMSGSLSATPPPKAFGRPAIPSAPAVVIAEIKRTIAIDTLALFSQKDMSMKQQMDAVYQYYHGEGALVSEVEKFVGGAANYGNV